MPSSSYILIGSTVIICLILCSIRQRFYKTRILKTEIQRIRQHYEQLTAPSINVLNRLYNVRGQHLHPIVFTSPSGEILNTSNMVGYIAQRITEDNLVNIIDIGFPINPAELNNVAYDGQQIACINRSFKNRQHQHFTFHLVPIGESAPYDIAIIYSETTDTVLHHKKEMSKASIEPVNDFAHELAHEINNPLMAIQASATRLSRIFARNINNSAEPAVGEFIIDNKLNLSLHSISKSVQRTQKLVAEMTSLGRDRYSHTMPAIKVADVINNSISETIIAWSHEYGKPDCEVRLNAGADTRVNIERLDLHQLITNLLRNSLAYLPKDQPGEIEISVYDEQEKSIIEMTDNGKGINTTDMNSLFERGVSGQQNESNKGLGLSICKYIVMNHYHGDIAYTSKEGFGTTVTVQIPKPTLAIDYDGSTDSPVGTKTTSGY